jgi:O-methyltransferase
LTAPSRRWWRVAEPVHRLLLKPSVRQSTPFRVAQQLLQPQPQEDILTKAVAFASSCLIKGDYLEFGVYTGTSFCTAFHLAQAAGLHEMRFYAFDSFEGMPDDAEPGGSVHHDPGGFYCDRAQFENIIRDNGVDPTLVEIVAGWYDDVLNDELHEKLSLEKAAIVSADCGLYGSTSRVLRWVTDYVQDGTILIFGDWFSFRGSPQRGQQRAFAEWLEATPQITASAFHTFGWHGSSFILHRG